MLYDSNVQNQINQIREKCERIKPLVMINCITYNHEKYLRDALEGFVMQRADFPFVAIVHEDASTDGTAAILGQYAEKYPDIILPIYEIENQYSKRNGVLRQIMQAACQAAGAKYIAYCEGDDYWTDPLKLQKQVNYLECNPNCSLICANYDKYYEETNSNGVFEPLRKQYIQRFNDLIIYDFIATLTAVVRSEILNDYNEFLKDAPIWSFGDYPRWLFAATCGYVYVLTDNVATYRVLKQSASHGLDSKMLVKWAYSEFSVFDYFNDRFNLSKRTRKDALFFKCNAFAKIAIQAGESNLIKRISNFYKENKFYISWILFHVMSKFPKMTPLVKLIDERLYLKAPIYYLKSKYRTRDRSDLN